MITEQIYSGVVQQIVSEKDFISPVQGQEATLYYFLEQSERAG